jgi:hypothetical protein
MIVNKKHPGTCNSKLHGIMINDSKSYDFNLREKKNENLSLVSQNTIDPFHRHKISVNFTLLLSSSDSSVLIMNHCYQKLEHSLKGL